ncbi:MAG: glutamate--cysteine ligase, partial [Gammaproteobacteria bacterium]
HNQTATARHGRDPTLKLLRDGRETPLRSWATDITDRLDGICAALDGDDPVHPYTASLAVQREAIADPERTPSARILGEMREHRESFFHFAQRLSRRHREFFLNRRLGAAVADDFTRMAQKSLEDQARLEAADTLSFDAYLQCYFSQT